MLPRTYLVTGATKGIGRATSERLANLGHNVVGIARNASDASFPGTLISADLTNRTSTQNALDALLELFQFDGVVNNVGFVKLARIGEIDLQDVENGFRDNLVSSVQIVQALLPGMRERGFGRIVNISSLTALGIAQRSVYAGAKSAMITFTRIWALELAETGITVNSVAPGPVATELFRANSPAGSDAEQKFLSLVPMKRLGKPSELGAAIAFLMSEDAGFITGQTLFVDGGASIGKAMI